MSTIPAAPARNPSPDTVVLPGGGLVKTVDAVFRLALRPGRYPIILWLRKWFHVKQRVN
jgi:hypothetical protein